MRLLATALTGMVLLAPAAAFAGPLNADSFVVTENEALLVTPPVPVATGIVKEASWSPDGKYVLALSGRLPYMLNLTPDRPPQVRSSLTLWNAATGEGKELWIGSAPAQATGEIAWFVRSEAAAVLLDLDRPVPAADRKPGMPPTQRERWLYRLDPRHSVMRPLLRVPDSTYLFPSPTLPLMMLWSPEETAQRVLRADGSITTLPMPKSIAHGQPDWVDGGKRVWIGVGPGADDKHPVNIVADPVAGTTESVVDRPQPYLAREPELPVHVRQIPGVLAGPEGTVKVTPLWLEASSKSEKPRALLAADAEWGKLSPTGEAVLYVDDRGAWVVRPSRMPKEAFIQARLAALRTTVISNGKQLALGLLMYAQDHDDTLPGAGDSVVAALQPYLKNDSMFENFSYTFPGGKLTDITSLSEQVVGHIMGPGGRAMIFADGHVTWEKDEKGR